MRCFVVFLIEVIRPSLASDSRHSTIVMSKENGLRARPERFAQLPACVPNPIAVNDNLSRIKSDL